MINSATIRSCFRGSLRRYYADGNVVTGKSKLCNVCVGGGSFAKKEHAQEEQYFRKKERDEIEKLKKHLKQEEEDKKDKKTDTDK